MHFRFSEIKKRALKLSSIPINKHKLNYIPNNRKNDDSDRQDNNRRLPGQCPVQTGKPLFPVQIFQIKTDKKVRQQQNQQRIVTECRSDSQM